MSTGAISRFVVGHNLLVVVVWLVIVIVSFGSISSVTGGRARQFTLLGKEGVEVSGEIQARYGVGGFNDPVMAVITLPLGTTVDSPGVREQLNGAFGHITDASPQAHIASYASTGDRAFVSQNGRTTLALAYLPGDDSGIPSLPAVKQAMTGRPWPARRCC